MADGTSDLQQPPVIHAPRPATQPPVILPPAVPVSVQVLDKLGEIIGCICVTVLALAGKLSGDTAVITICVILGVQQGLRQVGAVVTGRSAASAVGIVGIVFGAMLQPSFLRVVSTGALGVAHLERMRVHTPVQ